MTKRLKIIILAFVVTITLVLSVCIVDTFRSKAMSEGWRESGGGWWYEFSDGSYAKSEYMMVQLVISLLNMVNIV